MLIAAVIFQIPVITVIVVVVVVRSNSEHHGREWKFAVCVYRSAVYSSRATCFMAANTEPSEVSHSQAGENSATLASSPRTAENKPDTASQRAATGYPHVDAYTR